ncbi:hypothetical protein G9P44_004095 [Scheffersomyces stipitis]|nr:hypothetical protein G9P44_004095 [Scheffersomyces stipitis]
MTAKSKRRRTFPTANYIPNASSENESSSSASSQFNINNHTRNSMSSDNGVNAVETDSGSAIGAAEPSDSVNKAREINPGVYIDHRLHNDLAHLHSSPARSRRRSTQQQIYNANFIADNLNGDNDNSDKPTTLTRRYTADSVHSSGGSGRVMSREPSLPLTNRNLQSLLTQSDPLAQGPRSAISPTNAKYAPIALDMDKYARDQRLVARAQTWSNPFSVADEEEDEHEESYQDRSGHNDDHDRYSLNSLEFGGSNPSSDHSSDSTSLDDVCFPDYYGHEDAGNKESTYQWPDLKFLEEFVLEEFEEAEEERNELSQGSPNVNFREPVARQHVERQTSVSPKENQQENKIDDSATETTPLVASRQIDEVASLDSLQDSFRVRPTPIQPWDHSKEQIPTILQHQPSRAHLKNSKYDSRTGKVDGKLCRFTYFREDLEKTIHAPTIGGLISEEPIIGEENTTSLNKKWRGGVDNIEDLLDIAESNEEELEERDEERDAEEKTVFTRLQDLFQPSHYSQDYSSLNSTNGGPVTSPPSSNNIPSIAVPSEPVNLSTNNLNRTGSKSGLDTPGAATTVPSVAEEVEPRYIPFWLDVLDPTEEEMKVLSKTFGIHPLTTEDIFLGETREKVELFKSYYFICFTSFDVVYERRKQRAKEHEKKMNRLQELYEQGYDGDDASSIFGSPERRSWIRNAFNRISRKKTGKRSRPPSFIQGTKESASMKSKGKKIREGELSPLNMYMIVFKNAVITFHFSATPHPINVRRRARLLREYLTVTSDWICYALIDDITDSFAPMIDSIEEEVNSIEDAILKMHSGEDSDDDSESDDSGDENEESHHSPPKKPVRRRTNFPERNSNKDNVFIWRKRSKSTVDHGIGSRLRKIKSENSSKTSSKSSSTSSRILGWKRKGDMLRRIGECRKRVMSVLRLLGSKADVIKGFSKRFSEAMAESNKTSSKGEIGMYLGDIQDHVVTMVQSLNHYEKLLARFHSNYLAQINIDMTKVNNDTNDVLGKITILGTIVLPINVVTGLWGMNCVVPGQEYDSLTWFYSIVGFMCLFSIVAYNYARKVTGL